MPIFRRDLAPLRGTLVACVAVVGGPGRQRQPHTQNGLRSAARRLRSQRSQRPPPEEIRLLRFTYSVIFFHEETNLSNIFTNPDDENPYQAPENVDYIPGKFFVIPDSLDVVQPWQPSKSPLPSSEQNAPIPLETKPPQRNPGNILRTLALVAVIIVLIAASVSTIYVIGQAAKNKANARATTVASMDTAQANVASTAAAETAQAQATTTARVYATATAYASLNPYPSFKTIAINDSLTGNSSSDWFVGALNDDAHNSHGGCDFTTNAYSAITNYAHDEKGLNFLTACQAHNSNFKDFVFQVQMKIVKGDCGGLIVRSDDQISKFYLIVICQDGIYNIERYKRIDYPNVRLELATGISTVFKHGLQKTNLIAVAAHGDILDIFANKQRIASVRNGEYKQGEIGVIAFSRGKVTEVTYNNAQVWTP